MLERYGWSDALRQRFEPLAALGLVPARVTVQQRGHYQVVADQGELTATLAGKFAYDALEGDYPVAGDWVGIAARVTEESATIHRLLARTGKFVRREAGPGAPRGQVVAANVDVAFLVASLHGELNLRRIERYLASAFESGADPVIVLTKTDMVAHVAALKSEVEAIALDVRVLAVSAMTGEGMNALGACLEPGKTAVLVGSSGVGKSTLVNALAGETRMQTRDISADQVRGRHTTTHRELILLPSGALILDTPGMRELGLWDADTGVSSVFGEIDALSSQCRFHDCRHHAEPGCAVRSALADGSLTADRWDAYCKLQRELRFQRNKDDWALRTETRRERIRKHKDGRARMRFKLRGEE